MLHFQSQPPRMIPRFQIKQSGHCQDCHHRRQGRCLLQEDEEWLEQPKRYQSYKAGQILAYQGTPIFGLTCVIEGSIALQKLDPYGNETIVELVHPGGTLGHQGVFTSGEHTTSARALTPCTVCFIDKRTLEERLEKHPRLSLAFLQRTSEELLRAREERLSMISQPIRTRLVQFLLLLKDHYGNTNQKGDILIDLPLSRKDLASILGTRPETLSRLIRSLQQDKIVVFQKKRVVISDLDKLFDELEAAHV